MTVKPLQDRFIEELGRALDGWTYVAARQHFRRRSSGRNHLAHIAFINHPDDFDATIDVSVEFLSGRKAVCILGAELGNIAGSGQRRYHAASSEQATTAAFEAFADLERVGFPFLERYSLIDAALAALREGDRAADLLSPLRQLHEGQIAALEALRAAERPD